MTCKLSLLESRVREVDPQWTSVTTAWNDGTRGVDYGFLSCWGSNITDVTMGSDGGGAIPFVRPHNMDETVGITTSDKIVLHDGKTLHEYLRGLSMHDEKVTDAGFTSFATGVGDAPEPVLVRVQYSWVPLATGTTSRKVAPQHFSYQTIDPKQPANVIVTDTRCGTFLDHDGVGNKKLFAYDNAGAHWHVAEATSTAVGSGVSGATDANVVMGLEGMTPHENVFLVVSLPRKQPPPPPGDVNRSLGGGVCGVYRSLAADDGVSSAARLSVDAEVAAVRERHGVAFERDTSQQIWVTIMMFNTVQAAPHVGLQSDTTFTPAPDDVRHCVEEGKKIYGLCDHVTKLSCVKEALCKLAEEHMAVINKKLAMSEGSPPKRARIVPDDNALAAFV